MLKLWSGVLSPFSAKIRIALAEKDLPYETCEVPWSREKLWGPKPAEFLAISPRGQVPVLVDGELSVYDSTVIAEYLEERNPEPALYPREIQARVRCRQLEDEADNTIQFHLPALVQEVFIKRDEASRDQVRVETASKAIQQYYTTLNGECKEREYLCERFTIADIASFLVMGFGTTLGVVPDASLHHLHAWLERVRSRPTVGREFEAMMKAAATV